MYTVLSKTKSIIVLQHIYSKINIFWNTENDDLLFVKDNWIFKIRNSWNPKFEIPAYVEYLNIYEKEWNV